jgi:hypothetical protein
VSSGKEVRLEFGNLEAGLWGWDVITGEELVKTSSILSEYRVS